MAVGENALNYAVEYSRALAMAFPYSLYFGALYATPNNGRYQWVDAKTIKIPTITTSGRTAANRDSIGQAARHYENDWETKELTNERCWSTLIHPMNIDQTNMVGSIQNITQAFNEFQKFPEMDAYTASSIYTKWTQQSMTASTTVLTTSNILEEFDSMMVEMDNNRVPVTGRILYVTNEVAKILNNAQGLTRTIQVDQNTNVLDRRVNRLDEVTIVKVPQELMRTAYVFTEGYVPGESAKYIKMMLIHPLAVITPVSYTFASLDAPSAMTQGKWYYYEESFEDVFILNQRKSSIQFVVNDN